MRARVHRFVVLPALGLPLLLLGFQQPALQQPAASLRLGQSTGQQPKSWPSRRAVGGRESGLTIGGPTAPDGRTQVACDLPVEQRTHNVGGSDGAGLCVFTSIGHAARWQHERRLEDFQTAMRQEPGGGYPEKVDRMIQKYGGGTPYLQYEGNDPLILYAALKTGRMPSVTYNGHDPHYGLGTTIAHMTNLVALTDQWACILDNNFIGEKELVWMTAEDFFKRWKGGERGWAVILLAPPPPPVPKN